MKSARASRTATLRRRRGKGRSGGHVSDACPSRKGAGENQARQGGYRGRFSISVSRTPLRRPGRAGLERPAPPLAFYFNENWKSIGSPPSFRSISYQYLNPAFSVFVLILKIHC